MGLARVPFTAENFFPVYMSRAGSFRRHSHLSRHVAVKPPKN